MTDISRVFFWQTSTHIQTNKGTTNVGIKQKKKFKLWVSRYSKKCTSRLCLFLDFFVKNSPNHLSFHYEKLFLVNNIFKNLYIQIKNLYGYKLVSAEKQSKKILKDPVSIKEGITQSNVNYLHKRKSKYLCHLLHS